MINKLKPAICFLLVILLIIPTVLLSGCQKPSSDKPVIVTTLFPQYDFVRQLCGDDVEPVCLLSPGVESHSFDPSPKDIQTVSDCALFIYTGDDMEPWASSVIDSFPDVPVLRLTDGINLLSEHSEDDHHHEDGSSHSYDPHIWLNLQNAQHIVKTIADKIIELFPHLTDTVSKNQKEYCAKLNSLDKEFETLANTKSDKTVVFGGRFAYAYFINRYEVKYKTVFSGCTTDVEPSAKHVEEIINFIKQNDIQFIMHEELSDPKVARSIAEATGVQLLEFSTGHNISKNQFDNGITFLNIMQDNYHNLKIALGEK